MGITDKSIFNFLNLLIIQDSCPASDFDDLCPWVIGQPEGYEYIRPDLPVQVETL